MAAPKVEPEPKVVAGPSATDKVAQTAAELEMIEASIKAAAEKQAMELAALAALTQEEKIAKLPIFKRFQQKFIRNPGHVWILEQLITKGPLTTDKLYDLYLQDQEAQQQKLFSSGLTRQIGIQKEKSAPAPPFQRRLLHALPPQNGTV